VSDQFTREMRAFFRDDVEGRGTAAFQEAAQQAAEAIIIGSQYGPGAPLDTGFLRASFRVSRNRPEDGPSEAPPTPGRQPGAPPIFTTTPDTSQVATAVLGDEVFITTVAEYAQHLEENGLTRRNGPRAGQPTEFIAPVEARWPAILDDAARRAGYGR
jgi:hypothetical protein